jgi:hypothetical protein
MGQKSRAKRQQQKSRTSAPTQNNQRVVKEVMPASLMGTSVPVSQKATTTKLTSLDAQTAFIRGDIVRILLLLVIVIVLITIFHFVGVKTPYLHDSGVILGRFFQL